MTKKKQVEQLYNKLKRLRESPLYKYRLENNYKPVLGEGNLNANILFIGEAPGKKEAESGKPFIGSAGKLLDTFLESVGLKRKDIYITNIVNDRPPNNRDPKHEEIKIYSPILEKIIEIISPKIIATLGRFSMEYILIKYGFEKQLNTIGNLHGKVFKNKDIKVIPLYHPAAAIYNQKLRPDILKDFKTLKREMQN
ncbi:uracil-DNA glycosylase [candidate division WWE3 bacterium CG10_big_fil_rev_8_21_14_0_10_32_10]|uniref:Type-4 uracil-DNA glycosylase n=1 Tax=candidate division WWE3 bacterium CG10_big_fil_rev_8_21_14_0_10_32_10 TaxID=1975090 RepID=A0A2H0RBF7_UNCKA|nr:MAG: uracil-DNA glycosylase [candidate division WWE3 bacterium CG10_big_fil_rev_8_21_14_0_10_32_10]